MTTFLVALVVFVSVAAMAGVATRSAYRMGVVDGFDRAQRPTDPLFNTNGVNVILREFNRA